MNKNKPRMSGSGTRSKAFCKKDNKNCVNWEWVMKIHKRIDGKHVTILPEKEEVWASMLKHFELVFPQSQSN